MPASPRRPPRSSAARSPTCGWTTPGTADDLTERARELWYQRILPFAHNVQIREPARSAPGLVPADPTWPEQARRIVARLNTTCGHRALRIDHIGSTAVPGLDAKDVIDIQVTVDSLDVADELADALLRAGYPRTEESPPTSPKPDARSTVAEFDHTDAAASCGTSGFTPQPTRVGRRTCTSGSTAGPISSSRCCSSTG